MRIGVGLSIPELATRGGRFSPASLFTGGVVGAWYDPSDINNYMAGLGSELVTNGDFATGTTSGFTATSGNVGGSSVISSELNVVAGGGGSGGFYQDFAAPTNSYVRVNVTGRKIAGSGSTRFQVFNGAGFVTLLSQVYDINTVAAANSYDVVLGPVTSGTVRIYLYADTSTTGGFDNISVKQVTTIANATLFQDSAGTTPVTAVEQPVGLMLDKSQGLSGSGSQLVTNGDFSSPSTTGWQASAGGSFSVVSNRLQVTGAGATGTGAAYTLTTIVGMTYTVSFDVVLGTATVADSQMSLSVAAGSSIGPSYQYCNVNGTYKYSFVATATTTYFQFHPRGTGNTASVDNFSVISLGIGNHASQATAASRPILRARYNLLTYSEQFDNAAWTKRGLATAANTTLVTAPDGTSTADIIQGIAGGGASDMFQGDANIPTGAQVSPSFYIYRISTSGTLRVSNPASSSNGVWNIDLSMLSNAWERITSTHPAVTIATAFTGSGAANNGIQFSCLVGAPISFYLWGADLRTGSSAGTYQRIAAATDYATAGFAPYLAFDGVDDFLGAAYVQNAYPLTIAAGINTDASVSGSVGIVSVAQSDTQYKVLRDMSANGTDANDRNAGNPETADIIVSGSKFSLSQFETSLITHQVNGGTATTAANTNAFGTSANIFVGKVRPAGLFSSARDYGVVITNTVLTAAEKDSLKNWMAGKMGVVI